MFYLVYTVVTAFYCNMYDTHNYIVTASDIMGPWSEPTELPGFGFGNRTEKHEAYSLLTTRHNPEYPLQKAGHCELVETPNGEWYAVHLCGRPLDRRNPDDAPRFAGCRRYLLGRETAIQRMV